MNVELFDGPCSFLQLLTLLLLDELDLVEFVLQTRLVFNQLDYAFSLHLKVFLKCSIFILIQLGLGRVFAIFFNYSFIFLIKLYIKLGLLTWSFESLLVLNCLSISHSSLDHRAHFLLQSLVLVEQSLQAVKTRPLRAGLLEVDVRHAAILGPFLAFIVVLVSGVTICFQGLVQHIDFVFIAP